MDATRTMILTFQNGQTAIYEGVSKKTYDGVVSDLKNPRSQLLEFRYGAENANEACIRTSQENPIRDVRFERGNSDGPAATPLP